MRALEAAGTETASGVEMASARSLEELIVWQLADRLKVRVYELIAQGPITRDRDLADQLRRSASSAPRLIAEGFGRYLPGDFSRYLRSANGELNEILDCLKDGVDRGCFTTDEIVPLQRLAKRTSKAATRLIAYLRTAHAPHEPRGRQARGRRTIEPREPGEPANPSNPSNPSNPLNPSNRTVNPEPLEPREPS